MTSAWRLGSKERPGALIRWTNAKLLLHQRGNRNMRPIDPQKRQQHRLRILQLHKATPVRLLNRFDPEDRVEAGSAARYSPRTECSEFRRAPGWRKSRSAPYTKYLLDPRSPRSAALFRSATQAGSIPGGSGGTGVSNAARISGVTASPAGFEEPGPILGPVNHGLYRRCFVPRNEFRCARYPCEPRSRFAPECPSPARSMPNTRLNVGKCGIGQPHR